MSTPCDQCPWVRNDPICERPDFKEAALAGAAFMCHARGGHPPCTGIEVWRRKQKKKKTLAK